MGRKKHRKPGGDNESYNVAYFKLNLQSCQELCHPQRIPLTFWLKYAKYIRLYKSLEKCAIIRISFELKTYACQN